MKRALFLLLAACASSEKPHTEVAIAPPTTTGTTPDAGNGLALDASMNAEPAPNNNESGDALVVEMHPKPVHGTPVIHVDNDTSEMAGQRLIVRRVLRQNIAPFRACYEKGLRATPDLAGRVVVRFTIEKTGNVARPESANGTTLQSPDVVACVVHALEPLVFPEPRGGSLIVHNYPIVFLP